MIDLQNLVTMLRANGLSEKSPTEQVGQFLHQLNYTDGERSATLGILRSNGWFNTQSSGITNPQASTISNVTTMPNPAPTPVSSSMGSMMEQSSMQSSMIGQPVTEPAHKSSKKVVMAILGLFILILIGGGVAFAYVQKIGPFSISTYSETNFLSSLLAKFAQIDSSTYSLSGSLKVLPREKDAVPFELKVSNEKEMKLKYFNDSKRLADLTTLVGMLRSYAYGYYDSKTRKSVTGNKIYPNNIKDAEVALNNSYASRAPSYVDPATNEPYKYEVTDGGKNFRLTATFETTDAVNSVTRPGYSYTSKGTTADGLQVTFTEGSQAYMMYFSDEPPKPFLVSMSDSLRSIPQDIDVLFSVTAKTSFKTNEATAWTVNLNAEGNFGDLSYKVNADALKKDSSYFFRINNIPSLFMGDLGNIKGKWVDVSSDTSSSSSEYDYSQLTSIKDEIPKAEKAYKENRAKSVKFMKKAATIADELGLFSFKNKPSSETVEGRKLVRYNISLKKEKILPLFQKLQTAIENDSDFTDLEGPAAQGLINYLQSDEFNQVFDYFDKNNQIVFWTDKDGFPAKIQNTMRIVPPDTATQLAEKQINIVFTFTVADINKDLDIKIPTDAVPVQKLIDDINNNLGSARAKGEAAATMANLSAMRAQAELVYSSKGNSYGKNPFALGPCSAKKDTLFGDASFEKLLLSATKNSIGKATCVSKGKVNDVQSWAVSTPLPDDTDYDYCVDSSGASTKIVGAIKTDSCK